MGEGYGLERLVKTEFPRNTRKRRLTQEMVTRKRSTVLLSGCRIAFELNEWVTDVAIEL